MTKITNTSKNDPIVNLVAAMGEKGSGIYAQESAGQRELCKSDQLPTKLGGYDKENKACQIYKELGFEVAEINKSDELFVEVKMLKGWHKKSTAHSMWSDLVDDKGRKRASIFYKAAFYDREAYIYFENRFSVSVIKWLPDEKKYKTEKYTYTEHEEPQLDGGWRNAERIQFMDGIFETIIKGKPIKITKTGTRKVSIFKDHYEEISGTPYYAEVYDGDKLIFRTRARKFKTTYLGKNNDTLHSYWWREHERFEKNIRRKAMNWLNKNYPGWNNTKAYWD